ncbi:MAG: AI-2E family transporter [Lachnospiraceae bacterium]|nr:AI-2E family transporter [Muribaculum sp.]MCM1409895.1 AI-2E family transporter [Lachnospiraceae bacterium]
MKSGTKKYLFLLFGIFALFLCIYYWQTVSGILGTAFASMIPLLGGLATAYVLNILVEFYERHFFPAGKKKVIVKYRRGICIFMAVLSVVLFTAAVILMVVPQLLECVTVLLEKVPGAIEKALLAACEAGILTEGTFSVASDTDWQACVNEIANALTGSMGGVMEKGSNLFAGVFQAFLGVVFALYIVSGKEKLKGQCKRVMSVYLGREQCVKICHILAVLDDCFHKFVVGQCMEAVLLGVLCGAGMWILRFPYALMIGTLVGVTALIPVLGAYIGAAVGAVMMLTISPMKALLFLIYIVILQQLEGNLIYPRVVGSSIGLPGIWVLAAVTIGGGVAGVPGMLAGVPLAAAAYRLLREQVNERVRG